MCVNQWLNDRVLCDTPYICPNFSFKVISDFFVGINSTSPVYYTNLLHRFITPIYYTDNTQFNPQSVWNSICSIKASLISQNEINFFIARASVVSAKKPPIFVHSLDFLFWKKYFFIYLLYNFAKDTLFPFVQISVRFCKHLADCRTHTKCRNYGISPIYGPYNRWFNFLNFSLSP